MIENSAAGDYSLRNLGDAVGALGNYYSFEDIITEAHRQQSLSSFVGTGTGATFVTVGRLSPEKNHARLIRAFALIAQNRPGSQAHNHRRRPVGERAETSDSLFGSSRVGGVHRATAKSLFGDVSL